MKTSLHQKSYFFFDDMVEEAGEETADDNGVSSKSCSEPSSLKKMWNQ